jgi:1,4-alpha-glucan branching enzyme
MLNKPTKSANSIKTAETNNSAPVRLVIFNPEAYEVSVAGSFNNWHPGATPMKESGHGRWAKDLSLPPGRYEYQFVVDGRWVPDWTAKEEIENPFGGLNSVLEVPPARKPVRAVLPDPVLAVGRKEREFIL